MDLNKSQRRYIMLLLFAVPLLMGMGVDLYVPSLPAITAYFDTVPHWVQLTIGLYMLGYGVGQFFLGILSDATGRRIILLSSAVLYAVISILAANASDVLMLNICRFIQGIGIAGVGVVARAIAMDCFSGLDLTKALTCFSMSWALGPIIGPFIGSYLQHYINWQANFYFFAIYGIAILIYAVFYIPETLLHRQSIHPRQLYKNTMTVCLNPVFLLGSCAAALIYSVLVVFNVIGPFLIQTVLNYSVIAYGQVALLLGVAYLLGNTANRLLINRYAPQKLAFFSIVAGVVISGLMLLISIATGTNNIVVIFIPVACLIFFSALILPNTVAKSVSLFPKIGGTANAVCGTIVAGGVFVMSSIASLLKPHSQEPLAILYVLIFVLCLFLYTMMLASEKKLQASAKSSEAS